MNFNVILASSPSNLMLSMVGPLSRSLVVGGGGNHPCGRLCSSLGGRHIGGLSNYNRVWFKTPSDITGHFICLPMGLKDCPTIIFDLISVASKEVVKFRFMNGHILYGDYDLKHHSISQYARQALQSNLQSWSNDWSQAINWGNALTNFTK